MINNLEKKVHRRGIMAWAERLCSLLTCLMLMVAVAVVLNGKVLGQDLRAEAGVEAAVDIRWEEVITPKTLSASVVILMAAVLPLVMRDRRYRSAQLLLNVLVLGLWCGNFVSYSLIVNYLSNGANVLYSFVSLLLLVVAFVYPLFGRKGHYCAWVCPLGSLQELAGRGGRSKWKLGSRLVKGLGWFRDILWAVLMLLMLTGVWFKWMDYELFGAFMLEQARPAVLGIAIVFVLLSCFISRPYCRFVCPTGRLMELAEGGDYAYRK